MAQAVSLWQQLTASKNYGFNDYATFLLTYPGFPDANKLQGYAEDRLRVEGVAADRLVAFFNKYPPQSNFARAQYAIAQLTLQSPTALETMRAAWRGGEMDPGTEATLLANYSRYLTQDDQDARMDALLWQRNASAAARQIGYTSAAKRGVFQARLAIIQGGDGFVTDPAASADPGYLYNRSRELRTDGRQIYAVNLVANRPRLSSLPFDQTAWVGELLNVARLGSARDAERIAASIDDGFKPGEDISSKPYKLRDDYTSLMWLGATRALWELGDAAGAAPLFYRYAAAARTSPTKTKGLYWAGIAAQQAGDQANGQRYLEMAAQYPDRFYGQLALERLGRPLPQFQQVALSQPSPADTAAFNAKPLVQAIRQTARVTDWRTERYFFTALADQAKTPGQMQLVANLADELGLPELAVVVGRVAPEKDLTGFTGVGFPVVATPMGADYTMVHAIARQESEFDIDRVSHAGARGLMQLMPGTANEQAGKLGVAYMSASLTQDPQYNIRLGDAYFARQMDYFGGSYPLAVAAYNAGAGNVNKWLRANGDPRTGSVDWLQWIENIPIFETKNYVQRVLENAVVYEALHPERVRYGSPRGISQMIGKRSPG